MHWVYVLHKRPRSENKLKNYSLGIYGEIKIKIEKQNITFNNNVEYLWIEFISKISYLNPIIMLIHKQPCWGTCQDKQGTEGCPNILKNYGGTVFKI